MPTKRGRGIIYARPSFIEGMARVFDMGGTLEEYEFVNGGWKSDVDIEPMPDPGPAPDFASDPYGHKADVEAMRSDWQAIGDDMRAVMGDYDDYCVIETDNGTGPNG